MKKIETKSLTWIDIKDPNGKDIAELKKSFGFHDLALEELIPPSQRSKVEQFDNSLYLVLYFPVFHRDKKETELRELDIIIGKDVIVTSHYKSIIPLKELFDQCNLYPDAREKYMSQGPGLLLYYLIENLLQHSLPKLDNIARKIDKIEKNIFTGKEKEMLTEISLLKRDILNMAKAIKPERGILQSLNRIAPKFFGPNYNIYYQDLLGSYSYVRGVLESNEAIIDSLAKTNESLLSHKLNDIVKVLTIISFITFPLSVIAGIFGMNVYMGFAMHKFTFWIVLAFMATISMIMTVYFKKKKWL